MVAENEIIMLLLGLGIYIFTPVYRVPLQRLPHWRIFLIAFRILLFAWLMTVLEGFVWHDLFNSLEHLGYACSAVAMALWCYRITRPATGASE